MAYDTKCYDLAEAFLEDSPHLNTEARRHELAQLIQTTIEDHIAYEDRHPAQLTPDTTLRDAKGRERSPGTDPKTAEYSTAQMLRDEMYGGDTSQPLFD